MRAAGAVLALAWDAFCYDVVITRLDLEYRSPWWITYRIECTVLSDLAQAPALYTPDLVGSIVSDLNSADSLVGLGGLVAQASVAGALAPGGSAVAPVTTGLRQAQASIGPAIASAEQSLSASDVPGLVNACGALAQLATAQGFVGRALANLSGIQV